MNNWKISKLITLGALVTLALGLFCSTGCKTKLESGGAYAPAGLQPDIVFFGVDAAYQIAYNTVDAAFTFERNNRAYLWSLSPNIKHTLDQIRPQAAAANSEYLHARSVYLANPVPANLSAAQSALAKIQQLVITATSVLPK